MGALAAAEKVLRSIGTPMHYLDISRQAIARGLWKPRGRTPAASLNAELGREINRRGDRSQFVRAGRGVFRLRNHGPSLRNSPKGSRRAGRTPNRPKLGMREIKALALELVRQHPNGIRFGELRAEILARHPMTNAGSVAGAIWRLDAEFPDRVKKPERGLFVPVDRPVEKGVERVDRPPRPTTRTFSEGDFYESFAQFLVKDTGDATLAVPLGGAVLGQKWGTPDVIGVYKRRPSDRIDFPTEIVSAEIKSSVLQQASVVAFGQAVSYRLFSSKAYVVMPRSLSSDERTRLEALCMLFGVGLVLFDLNPAKPNYQVRVRAQRFSPDMYYVNKLADSLHRHDSSLFDRLFG